jgi:hypothetical protein
VGLRFLGDPGAGATDPFALIVRAVTAGLTREAEVSILPGLAQPLTFTPTQGYVGAVPFGYGATDDLVGSGAGAVAIAVRGVDQAARRARRRRLRGDLARHARNSPGHDFGQCRGL